MVKKTFPYLQILAFALLVSTVTGFTACSTIGSFFVEKPKVTLDHIGLKEVSALGATVLFAIQVENPNGFALKVDSVHYDAEVGGRPMSAGAIQNIAAVPAHGKAIIELPVPIKYLDVFTSLLDFVQSRSTTYHVKGDATFGVVTVPFEQKGEFKLDK